VIAGATGKDEMGGKSKPKKKDYQGPLYAPHPDIKKAVKEGFSDWRQDLSEVMTDEENNKKIKEKKIENKITINPKLGEAVEELGGTLLEMVEVDEFDFVIESVYNELLDEGYEEDDIEEAIEYALTEAKVTFGHDTTKKRREDGSIVGAVGRLARQKLSSKVREVKKSVKQAVASGARKVAKGALGVARKIEGDDKKPSPAHTKTRRASTYRGAGVGTKERVGSGSYTPPAKKKAEKPSDPWEGSATTPPKAKTKKVATPKAKTPAGGKAKRKSKLDDLLASVRNESVQINEAGDWWHPDPEKDKMLPGRGPKLRAREDQAASKTKEDSKKLRPGESYMDFAKRHGYKPTREEYELGENTLVEKAPPGAKFERMVKHIKKGYSKGGLTKKEKSIAYATAWKQHNKEVKEQLSGDAEPTPIEQKASMLDKQKIANLKMLQQKKQVLDRQKLQMQKAGKLPLEASYQPDGEMIDERRKEDKVAGTPRRPRDRAFEIVAKSMGSGRLGVQPRGVKKVLGKKVPADTPVAKFKRNREYLKKTSDYLYSSPRD